jgi:hypothetical protein
LGYFNYGPGKLPQGKVFSGNKSMTYHHQMNNPIKQQTIATAREQMSYSLSINYYHREASLNSKGTFGVTNLKVCSQKIVPIFSFFFVWAGKFKL